MRTISVVSLLWLATAAATASAQDTMKPVSWFLNNPQARQRVVNWCNDNPGAVPSVPNCTNAYQANLSASAMIARQKVGAAASPDSPAYWRDPQNAPQKQFWAFQCKRASTQAQRQSLHCPAIEAAGG